MCALALANGTANAGRFARAVSEQNGEIVVEFVDDGTPSGAPVARFFVAIANQGNYSVTTNSSGVRRVENPPAFMGGESLDSLRARSAAVDTFRVFKPFMYRGTRVLFIEVDVFLFPLGTDAVYELVNPSVTIRYDPAPATNDAQTVDTMLDRLVVNEAVFPTVPRSTNPDPWFSMSSRWVKIPVTSRGVYAVTGTQLQSLGVSLPGGVNNPATFRMFSQFGQEQPLDLTDTGASWGAGNAMKETAIIVEDGGDGTFDPTDRVIFYGVGTEDWADYYDSAAPDTVHYRHRRAKTNYYYLTWDSSLPGSPSRMAQTAAAPFGAPYVTTYLHRDYFEQDRIPAFDFLGDGWLWLSIPEVGIKKLSLATQTVYNLDATQPQTFRTVALSEYRSARPTDPPNINEHNAKYIVRRGGVDYPVAEKMWTSPGGVPDYNDGFPVRESGYFLANGDNLFAIDMSTSPNSRDATVFAWFSVFYRRGLAALGNNNSCGFTSDDTTGAVTFRVSNFDASTTAYVFDVTEADAPVRLTGVSAGSNIDFGYNFSGTRRHFWAAKSSGLRSPSGMIMVAPSDLRADAAGANMLINTNPLFVGAAQRLRSYRLGRLPYYNNPRIKVVTTQDIYDNFSGGMPDAIAIRNYVKFMHDNYPDADNNPSLAYVLLFGDANEDMRNNVSSQPDYVPTNLFFTTRTSWVFVTDEWFGQLDPGDQSPGHGVLDVALGRLPVTNTAEANGIVDKIIGYETDPTWGGWRSRFVLVCDDEVSSSEFACDVTFTLESEIIDNDLVPDYLEMRKIYLTEYPRVSGIKPLARAAMLDVWNSGALAINYIGHGSSQQMADEQVFLGSDSGLLNNGRRLPLLLALSCTIGDFANYQNKSLSENLLLRDAGGVIGTVTASRETLANLNQRLDFAICEDVAPKRLGEPAPPVGETMMRSKLRALHRAFNVVSQEDNNWKYNLLCDPAVRLRAPTKELRFDVEAGDSLVAGVRKTISGAVYSGGVVDTNFDGNVEVLVREPELDRRYETDCTTPQTLIYSVPGAAFYRGFADVVDGRFEVTFRVPRSARLGPRAFLSAYADDGNSDAAAMVDSVLALFAPTIADSLELQPADGSPRVTLGFKSGLKTVKPGETLQAVVRDADGINILETTNEGKQALLFDDFPVPIDANEFFTFDHNGADTSGVLLFPLPELTFGDHRVIYKVSDAFGQTSLDTLVFNVTDPQDFFAEVLLNYPNPFQTETQFLVRLSDPADIRLDIYTVSGRRIRRISETRDSGEVWIPWDGRDAHGGEIANGIYLYVATVDFHGVDRPPLTLRGKVSKIR